MFHPLATHQKEQEELLEDNDLLKSFEEEAEVKVVGFTTTRGQFADIFEDNHDLDLSAPFLPPMVETSPPLSEDFLVMEQQPSLEKKRKLVEDPVVKPDYSTSSYYYSTSNKNGGRDSLMSLTAAGNAHKKRPRKPAPKKELLLLPESFQPTPYTILCGKGQDNYNSIGNRRFRITVRMFLDRYNHATNRNAKMAIVDQVMNIIQTACPVGGFVKFGDNGRYYQVDDRTAREKVGAHFRDCLAEQYRSSAKNKIARRRSVKLQRRNSVGSSCCAGSVGTASTVPTSSEDNAGDEDASLSL